MRVFITGATGFIGSHVARRLAQAKHELRCLVRKTSDVTALREVGATLVPGDVTNKDSILKGMEGCNWVINLVEYARHDNRVIFFFRYKIRKERVIEMNARRVPTEILFCRLDVMRCPLNCIDRRTDTQQLFRHQT
ncbi:MAG: NAD-dependent epimerase/dehydratase family protein, partial [Bacteroidota bacterium]